MAVFISYATEDQTTCDELREALAHAHLSPWTSLQIPAGARLRESLRMAIERSDVCVLIATANSLRSGWCLAEAGAFWGADKPVVVYVADDKLPEVDVPELFRDYKWAASIDEVVRSVALLPEASALTRLGRRPANVFWLAHDLTNAIHMAALEPDEGAEIADRILHALHHLRMTGLDAADEERKLADAWTLLKSTAASAFNGKELADRVAGVRNDIVERIVSLQNSQGGFSPHPSKELKDKITQEAPLTKE